MRDELETRLQCVFSDWTLPMYSDRRRKYSTSPCSVKTLLAFVYKGVLGLDFSSFLYLSYIPLLFFLLTPAVRLLSFSSIPSFPFWYSSNNLPMSTPRWLRVLLRSATCEMICLFRWGGISATFVVVLTLSSLQESVLPGLPNDPLWTVWAWVWFGCGSLRKSLVAFGWSQCM